MSLKTVFMFSGQGSQYYQMGRQLFDTHPVFRQWMVQLDDLAAQLCGQRVLDTVYGSGKTEAFDQVLLTHPAIFMVEYALAQCLIHEGISPDATLGASLGSFAAAAVGGHITPEEAMAAVLEQAAAFEAHCEKGGMIAILAEPDLYQHDFLRHNSAMVGVNFNRHFAVSAPFAALATIESALRQRGVSYQRLAVAYAFHSAWIDAAEDQFAWFMRARTRARTSPPATTLPLVCCQQADTLARLASDYFWRVVRDPIRFQDAVAHLEQQGPWRYIDVGPSGTLATFVKYGLPAGSASRAHPVLTPYGQDQRNLAALLAAT